MQSLPFRQRINTLADNRCRLLIRQCVSGRRRFSRDKMSTDRDICRKRLAAAWRQNVTSSPGIIIRSIRTVNKNGLCPVRSRRACIVDRVIITTGPDGALPLCLLHIIIHNILHCAFPFDTKAVWQTTHLIFVTL